MDVGWIETSVGALFASYHAPEGGARSHAVLLCDALGSERMNLHLTYRVLAQQLASIGFPVLRVDYATTCDSSGYPRGASQISLALATLDAAGNWLRARSGTSRVCAFGAGLGGTLATLWAARRTDVTGLVLWSPLTKGRTFLRAAAALDALSPMNPQKRRPSDYEPGDREATGFLVSKATADELEAIDLFAMKGPNIERALVLGRSREAKAMAAHLRNAGAILESAPIIDFDVEHLYRSAMHPPPTLVEHVLQWATGNFPGRAVASKDRTSVLGIERRPRSSRSIASPLAQSVVLMDPLGRRVREDTAHFGSDRSVFGIVSRPLDQPHQHLPAVIMVNAGRNHRVGINRNYVDWARRLAAQGFCVLRLDVRGLGDSPPKRSEDLSVLFLDETVEDVRDAIDFMQQAYGTRSAICMALCSGAYQALHGAIADPRIVGIALLNPLRFQRVEKGVRPNIELWHGALPYYARAMLRPEAWRRLVTGEVDLRGISHAVAVRGMRRAQARVRGALATLKGSPPQASSWLAGTFIGLTGRGCGVLLVLDSGDATVPIVEDALAEDRQQLEASGWFTIALIEGADHIFRPLFSQELVWNILERTFVSWTTASRA